MINHLKTWWGVYGGAITAAALALLPAAQAFAAHHPGGFGALIGIAIAAAQRSPNK